MGSFVCLLDQQLAAGDDTVCALFGVQPSDVLRPVADFTARIHPDDLSRVEDAMARLGRPGDEYFEDFRVLREDGEYHWIAGRGKIIENDDEGASAVLVGVNWDIGHRKAEEERLSILAKEMNHRVKNAFSVINALIRLGSRSASSISSFADTLTAQIRAMSDAHRMSAQTAQREAGATVRLEQIVRMAVAPWLTGAAEQVRIDEREPVELTLTQISPFAMLAYELATNAAKYGALASADGRLLITIDRDNGTLLFTWDEQVGHPLTAPAQEEREKGSRSGFGTTLLQHCAATLKARMKRELRPQGLLLELRVP